MENRKIARILLQEKLDVHFNGENSVMMQRKKEYQKKKKEKSRRAKIRFESKKAMKEKLKEMNTDSNTDLQMMDIDSLDSDELVEASSIKDIDVNGDKDMLESPVKDRKDNHLSQK